MDGGELISSADLLREIKKDLIFYEQSGGVTFSGGEPMSQPDFLIEMLELAAGEYIHAAVDTSGFCDTSVILQAARLAKLILFDVKFLDESAHIKYCGASNRQILANLQALAEANSCVQVRIPVIPGVNTCEMRNIGEYLRNMPNITGVSLMPYHAIHAHKYTRLELAYNMPDIMPEYDISEVKQVFEEYFETKVLEF